MSGLEQLAATLDELDGPPEGHQPGGTTLACYRSAGEAA